MAGRPCEACRHPEREQIDAALLAGTPFRTIAERYGMAHPSLLRHRNSHLAAKMAEAAEARSSAEPERPSPAPMPAEPTRRERAADALDIVGQLRAINGAALEVLRDARVANDGRLVLSACDRVLRQLELQARLIGAIDERPQVTLILCDEWISTRAAILRALAPHPTARLAVVEALGALA